MFNLCSLASSRKLFAVSSESNVTKENFECKYLNLIGLTYDSGQFPPHLQQIPRNPLYLVSSTIVAAELHTMQMILATTFMYGVRNNLILTRIQKKANFLTI